MYIGKDSLLVHIWACIQTKFLDTKSIRPIPCQVLNTHLTSHFPYHDAWHGRRPGGSVLLQLRLTTPRKAKKNCWYLKCKTSQQHPKCPFFVSSQTTVSIDATSTKLVSKDFGAFPLSEETDFARSLRSGTRRSEQIVEESGDIKHHENTKVAQSPGYKNSRQTVWGMVGLSCFEDLIWILEEHSFHSMTSYHFSRWRLD